jgi:anti-sigma-K factor RskA
MTEEPPARRSTVAIYDRPQWWRTRRFWRIALPAVVAVASVAIWYAVLA